jgi:hypothetical protein
MTVNAAARQVKLLDRLSRGEHVQNRDAEIWLTLDAWAAYQYELAAQKQVWSHVKSKP